MSFPPYPKELEEKAWESHEKKLKLRKPTGIGKELEDLQKEYKKIGTEAFDGLETIKSPEALTRRRSEVAKVLKTLQGFGKSLSAFDGLASKTITELKSAKADATAIKALQKIQNAATDIYEASKDFVGEVEKELDKVEKTLNGKKDEEEKEEEAPPGADKFLLAGLKFCKSKPGLFAFAIGKENHLILGQRIVPRLLSEAKKKTGGKFIRGECFFEANTYVFQLKIKPPGGLARKIKKAILGQSVKKANPKVVVRGPDGTEIGDENDTDNLATDLQLEDVAELPAAATTAGAKGPAVGTKVAYAQLLLAWDAARKKASAELKKLEKAILDEFAKDADFAEIQQKLRKLDQSMAPFGSELQDALDEAQKLPDSARGPLHQKAREIIVEYQDYVDGDAFVNAIETNPFVPVAVQSTLSTVLTTMLNKLPG